MKQLMRNGHGARYGGPRKFIAVVMILAGCITGRRAYSQGPAGFCTTTNADGSFEITVTWPPSVQCGSWSCGGAYINSEGVNTGELNGWDGGLPTPNSGFTGVYHLGADMAGGAILLHGCKGGTCDCFCSCNQGWSQQQNIGDCTDGQYPGNDPCQNGQATTEASTQSGEQSSGQQSEDDNQNVDEEDPLNLGTGATFFEAPELQPVPLPGNTLSAALAFGRFQSSRNPTPSQLQGGWTHNYNVVVADVTNSVVMVVDWQGSRHTFTYTNNAYNGDGTSTLTKTNGNFVWQLTHGTRYQFAPVASGYQLSNITDRVGNYVSFTYNASGLLTGVVDSAGRPLTFNYNDTDALTSVVDPIGRTTTFGYDALGRLVSASDALGTKARYIYGDPYVTNGITRFINARGYTNSFTYNSLGQAIAQTNALGKVQTFSWSGSQVSYLQYDGVAIDGYNNSSGAVTAQVDAAGSLGFLRDTNERLTNYLDRLGHSTQYQYDSNSCACALSGSLLMEVDALGRTNLWTYDPTFKFRTTFTNAAGGVTLWTYDSKGNVLTNTDAAGEVTTYSYDSAGNRTSATDPNTHTTNYGYDQYGNRTNITDALSHSTGFTYDLVGRLTGRTDALGRSELFKWDDRDRLVRYINRASSTNLWGYDANGNRTAWTNELGYVRSYGYDVLDRLTSITLPDSGSAFLTFGYDDANNRTSVTDALGNQTQFGYDTLGRLTAVTNPLSKVWSFAVDAEGRCILATDPNTHSQGFVYDAVGQLTGWTNALTQVTTFGYDPLGNLTNVTDGRSNPLTFGYDAVSRLTNVTYAGGSTEQFFHDGAGNVTSIVTRAGQSIASTYDAANRLAQKSYVGISNVVTYGYDVANQLTGMVAAVSGGSVTSVLSFAHDAAGRLTNEIQTIGSASPLAVGYQYFADGRRSRLTYPDGTFITYVYNANGWLTAIEDGGTNVIVSYDYDAAGRRTQRTLENNTFTIYDFDAANQLISIWHQVATGGSTNTISRYEYGYDGAGNRSWVKRAQQSNEGDVYTYDAANQLTDVKYDATNPDGTPSGWDREVTYFYDAAGNRTGTVELVGSAVNTTTYAANSDNQLTSTTTTPQGLTVTGYVYPGPLTNKWYASVAEAVGVSAGVSQQDGTFSLPGVPVTGGANALTVTVTNVSGNIATQIVNVTIDGGTVPLGYDGNGNQTNDAVWSYAYDRENHLLAASSVSSAVYYSYDALGRQIQRIAGNSTNRLYYAGWQLVSEYDGAGNLQRKYVYGPGIDEPVQDDQRRHELLLPCRRPRQRDGNFRFVGRPCGVLQLRRVWDADVLQFEWCSTVCI